MNIIDTIHEKLTASLKPSHLSVTDSSAPHYGHDGVSPGNISHVAITVVSDAFSGKSRVDRSRMVHSAIADEIRQIHALTEMILRTPEEWKK